MRKIKSGTRLEKVERYIITPQRYLVRLRRGVIHLEARSPAHSFDLMFFCAEADVAIRQLHWGLQASRKKITKCEKR